MIMEKVEKKKYKIKGSKSDIIYEIISVGILLLLSLIVIYPIYFIIIASVSDPNAIFGGEVFLWPVGFTLSGYERLLEEELIWSGYLNTIIYTVLGTAFNIFLTIPTGWALSRNYLPPKNIVIIKNIIMNFLPGK